MSDVELIASYWTFAGGALPHSAAEYSTFEFKERCEAIARAGFKGIGLWHADIEHVLQSYTLPQMKRILDDNGLKHVEVEFLADWFLPPGERRTASDERREFLFKACEGLGARHLKVGDFFKSDCPMSRLIDEFGSLCREAAPRGIRIGYELMPFSVIETLEKTRRLVEGAAQKNGGVIFDLWHIVKLAIPYDDVMNFPAPYFMGLEINDGYLQTPAGMDMVTETTSHRKLCGLGEFDIKGFTSKLPDSPYRGPVGIEVLSQEL
ncbi:MAG TPA: sugar phosphate isomerase/epimerase family protein, partial [Steroidobacteraceae bacterium]|nr:sugar phosphate isomerase/epimerase family protein [Steroidobacteraceae bacterium]